MRRKIKFVSLHLHAGSNRVCVTYGKEVMRERYNNKKRLQVKTLKDSRPFITGEAGRAQVVSQVSVARKASSVEALLKAGKDQL